MASDIKLNDSSVTLEGATTVLQSGTVEIPLDAQGYPGMFRVNFDGANAHAGRIVLAPSWLGRAMMSCQVEYLMIQNPAIAAGARESLTHSAADELVLNHGKHYAGGVSVEGAVKLESLTVQGDAQFHKTVNAPQGVAIGAITIGVPDPGPVTLGPAGSVVTGERHSMAISASTIRVTTTYPAIIGTPHPQYVLDIVAEILSLRDRVAALEKKP